MKYETERVTLCILIKALYRIEKKVRTEKYQYNNTKQRTQAIELIKENRFQVRVNPFLYEAFMWYCMIMNTNPSILLRQFIEEKAIDLIPYKDVKLFLKKGCEETKKDLITGKVESKLIKK